MATFGGWGHHQDDSIWSKIWYLMQLENVWRLVWVDEIICNVFDGRILNVVTWWIWNYNRVCFGSFLLGSMRRGLPQRMQIEKFLISHQPEERED